MSNETGKRSIKDILNDMHARGGDFANFAEELFEAVNREFAEYANELKSEFSFLLRNNVKEADELKEAEDEEEPEVEGEEDEEDEPKGYISSRPVDKLQFNIDTLKLGNLPGAYKGIQEEGGFFKAFTTAWNNGDWEEGYGCLYGDDTVSNTLDGIHCYGNFWVNPKYANSKVSDLGDIGCRSVAIEGKTDICIAVYYLKKDGTVIAWDMDVD